MIEFWVVCGPTWRLPVSIEWADTLGEINLEVVSLLAIQRQALLDLVGPKIFARGGKVWIFRADLLTLAHPAPALPVEQLVEWLPSRARAEEIEFIDNDFIKGYCESEFAVSKDPAVMDVMWISLCKFALHWLVNEEREIDMIFARIIPLAFRKNWSNAAAKYELRKFREHQIQKSEFLCPNQESIIDRGLADYLASDNLTSFDEKTKLPRMCLEILEGREYREATQRREKARRQRWGIKFWERFFDRLKRQLPVVLEIYEHHLREAKYPYCKTNPKSIGGSSGKRPRTHTGGKAAPASAHFGEDCTLYPPIETSEPSNLPSADGCLPDEVPDLQSPAGDVRYSRGDVSGSG
jgi:hypothetical protein